MKHLLVAITTIFCGASIIHAQDRKLGTAFEWEKSIDDAAGRARKEKKLVLALHVSGHFDKPEFT